MPVPVTTNLFRWVQRRSARSRLPVVTRMSCGSELVVDPRMAAALGPAESIPLVLRADEVIE